MKTSRVDEVAWILVVIAMATTASATYPQVPELPRPLSESEVIHGQIDLHAQRAIVRLSNGSFQEREASRYLLRGVQYGALGGIYKVDTQVPALRAQRIGKNWWTLLEGRPAGCLTEPADEKPILIFGKTVATQPGVLGAALMTALDECGFRRLDVHVTKGTTVPCAEAFVTVSSDATGVLVNPACHTTTQGVCHFHFPPAMYQFNVTCDGETTSPPGIFRALAPGTGVQIETFDFSVASVPPTPPQILTRPALTRPTTPTIPTTPTTPTARPQPTVPSRVLRPTTSRPKIPRVPAKIKIPSRIVRPGQPPLQPPIEPEIPPETSPPAGQPVVPDLPPECSVQPVRGGECWTTEDVLNSTIDHHAQSAMFRMFAIGGLAAVEASQILCAVKEGALEGVFLPAQGVPAQRARAAGSNYWEMIPPSELSNCYKDQPPGPPRSPLIVFRDRIKGNRSLLASALRSAWSECDLPPSAARCYTETIARPKEPEGECETDQDCVDKSLGNHCTQENRCIWNFDDDEIEPKPQPTCLKCDPVAERIPDLRVCPAQTECSESTFCCTKIGGKEDICVSRIVARKFVCRELCDKEGERKFNDCFSLSDLLDAAGNPLKTAAKTTLCAARASEYSKACKLRHSKEADKKIEDCRQCANDSCLSLTLDCTL